ncbi:MAG: hypothetical protein EZS28_005853 [Streblomastix strix]|uniref:Uncharacterized protein n=1 Tax=Streblomastix strix TaxID=222440 RepID=A0A5J4WUN8_9EUKA|nr:MAG: hypothetical protein EZS28_005853 [Streblomastix strix]
MDVDIPSQLDIAAAAECNPSLVSMTLSNKLKKIVEKKESALLSGDVEGKLVEQCLKTIEQSGYITPIEIRIKASTMVRREESWQGCKCKKWILKIMKIHYKNLAKAFLVSIFLQADEVGYQQYADSRSKKIIVKKEDENKVLHFPIDRSEIGLSIMTCATFSSDLLKPFLSVKRPLNVDKFLETEL